MRALFILALLTAATAHAQRSNASMITLVGPPAVVALALDLRIIATLTTDNTASRGVSITAISFGAVSATLGLVGWAVAGAPQSRYGAEWVGLCGYTAALGFASIVLGIVGIRRSADDVAVPVASVGPRGETTFALVGRW